MVKKNFFVALNKNIFMPPAVVLAIVLYSGFIPLDFKHSYNALFAPESVGRISGVALDTPVLVGGKRKYYSLKMRLNSVRSKKGAFCNASGQVQVYVPAALYQVHSPGKLYTAWRGKKRGSFADEGILINQGAELEFDVVYKKNEDGSGSFYVLNINRCVWNNVFQKFRALCRLHFSRLMYAWGDAGGLILALLSGSREYLQGEISEAFKDAGLSHILALSGMHLSLFSGMAFFVSKKTFGKKSAHILQLFAILMFFWFAGKSPSLFRALLCSLCMIVSAVFHIKINSMLNVLALSFLIHITFFPADMFEIGFMLSYGALLGIICFNEFVSKPLSRALPYIAGTSLGQSTGAQTLTIPVCLKYFGLFTPGGIVASSVVSPIVTIFVYIAFACIILCLIFPFFAPVCGTVLAAFYSVLSKCVLFFARIPKINIG